MKYLIALALLAHSSGAHADAPAPMRLPAPPPARRALDMDGVFDRIMTAAGVGLTSGKIKLLRPMRCGKREEVATTLGKSKLMPLFDVNFHGASLFAHVTF